jgi:hypothetical protein
MRRTSAILSVVFLLSVLPLNSSAQSCGFPWTLTVTPAGGGTVLVNICGYFAGCRPHNPQFTLSGSHVNITVQGSEPPDRCTCIAVVGTFQESVLVHPLSPGTYTVTATLLSCDPPLLAGSTVFSLEGTSAIPALDSRGVFALVALLALAGIVILRR